jgi:hypothetical protein
MNNIQIEKNVPIPPRTGGQPIWVETARNMEVGDSVLCKPFPKNDRSCSLYHAMKKLGYKIAVRKEGEMIRVWRVG